MANVDRPNGFRPVYSLTGAPWNSLVRSAPPGAEDLYIGDPVTLSSGTLIQGDTNAAIAGVVVAVGHQDFSGRMSGLNTALPYDPTDLNRVAWYDTSAHTDADHSIFYAPADSVVFEVQTATALTLLPGDPADLVTALAGNTTTGISAYEITTASNNDVIVVHVPLMTTLGVQDDTTAVNARFHVVFANPEMGQAS